MRQPARGIDKVTDVHRRLIDDMFETMDQAAGVGLAGNQVGVLERIFVWRLEDRSGAVLNPVITERSEKTEEDEEGCLSIPGVLYPVERAFTVVLEGMDPDEQRLRIEASGLLARVFQHETDHLDGVLFIDRLDEQRRREAMRTLRDQALGLAPAPVMPEVRSEDTV